jgi:hypothetical protein
MLKTRIEALDEALERDDTQGAKEIILSENSYSFYDNTNIYSFYDKAFQLAAEKGNTDILKHLEGYIFDFNFDCECLSDCNCNSDVIWDESHFRWAPAFKAACDNRHGETARYIMDKAEYWLDQETPILRMYQCGELDYVGEYVKTCHDPKAVTCHIIDTACKEGDLKAVKYFVDTYKLTIKDYEGSLPVAAEEGHLPIVKYFIEKKADFDQRKDITGESIFERVEINLKYLTSASKLSDDEIFRYGYKSKNELLTKIQNIKILHDYILVHYPELMI